MRKISAVLWAFAIAFLFFYLVTGFNFWLALALIGAAVGGSVAGIVIVSVFIWLWES